MGPLQNLPFLDHPSNGESFQTVSGSNQALIDLLRGKLAGGIDKIELSSNSGQGDNPGHSRTEKFPADQRTRIVLGENVFDARY